MSQTSIGTGTPQDFNENPSMPAMGDDPSRTLGAGAGHTPKPPHEVNAEPGASAEPAGPLDTAMPAPSPDVPAELTDDDLLNEPVTVHMDEALVEIPDGLNVAPSPWEEDAARGHSELPPQ